MKSKTILGADGATKMRQITVGIHGKGGEAGIKAIQQLAGMVDSLKQCQTPQEVYDRYLQITGYCKCCVDCNFIDQKGADELMCLAAYLAGNEQARAEAQVYDVSAVSIPANGDTEISARAFASRSYEQERQELLKRRAAILKIRASL